MKKIFVNGKCEFISNSADFIKLMRENMGDDAEELAQEYISKLECDADYTAQKVNTDLESYEASLESNSRAFMDIDEICRTMISEFNDETGRNKLSALRPWYKQISEIVKIINNQI